MNCNVDVITFSKTKSQTCSKMYLGRYCIFLTHLDNQGCILTFISSKTFFSPERAGIVSRSTDQALSFHPSFIRGSSLEKGIAALGFFDHFKEQKLYLAGGESQLIFDCFAKIEAELQLSVDQHSHRLVSTLIELLLNYCGRFYNSRSMTGQNVNKGILQKFEGQLNSYFTSEKPDTIGLPSVAYFADTLNLSPNYFGDLIKKETGKTVREYIQNKIIDVAKERIAVANKSITEIAYELGFKYPQHFIRLFKQRVGYTPNEYRNG